MSRNLINRNEVKSVLLDRITTNKIFLNQDDFTSLYNNILTYAPHATRSVQDEILLAKNISSYGKVIVVPLLVAHNYVYDGVSREAIIFLLQEIKEPIIDEIEVFMNRPPLIDPYFGESEYDARYTAYFALLERASKKTEDIYQVVNFVDNLQKKLYQSNSHLRVDIPSTFDKLIEIGLNYGGLIKYGLRKVDKQVRINLLSAQYHGLKGEEADILFQLCITYSNPDNASLSFARSCYEKAIELYLASNDMQSCCKAAVKYGRNRDIINSLLYKDNKRDLYFYSDAWKKFGQPIANTPEAQNLYKELELAKDENSRDDNYYR